VGLRRFNVGCGSDRPGDWENFDITDDAPTYWDIRDPFGDSEPFDYGVISFMLQELDFHELPGALGNVRDILKPAGVVRILVPDIRKAFAAWLCEDEEWFPQDGRTGGLDAKFCTYLTWYGTSKSVFTPSYLQAVLAEAGFSASHECNYGRSKTSFSGMVGLDSRRREALIVEATK
jgi:predicted SAM-dependent methyltransferase